MQQRSLTSMLIGHIALVLVIGSHVLLCSSCSNAPMQLGMQGEGPSTSRNAEEEEIVDSDEEAVRDEEAVAHMQLLKDEIRKNTQKIDDTNKRILTIKAREEARRKRLEQLCTKSEQQDLLHEMALDALRLSGEHEALRTLTKSLVKDQKGTRILAISRARMLCDKVAILYNKALTAAGQEAIQTEQKLVQALEVARKIAEQAERTLEQTRQALQDEAAQARQEAAESQQQVALEQQARQAAEQTLLQERLDMAQSLQQSAEQAERNLEQTRQALQNEAAQARQQVAQERQARQEAEQALRQERLRIAQSLQQSAEQAERTLEQARQAAEQARAAVRQSEEQAESTETA